MLSGWLRVALALSIVAAALLPLASPAPAQAVAPARPADASPPARAFAAAPAALAPLAASPASVAAPDASLAAVDAQAAATAPALVLLAAGTTPSQYQAALALARAQGADVTLAYPPTAFVAQLPTAAEAALRGQPTAARIERGRVDVTTVQALGSAAATAVNAWNHVFQGGAAARAAEAQTTVPELHGPSVRVPPPPGGAARAAAPVAGHAPTVADTSAYMAGTAVVSVVFVQSGASSGNCSPADSPSEQWDAARRTTVLNEISQGMSFWTTRTNRPAQLTFTIEDLGVQQTSCEPIRRSSSQEGLWIADVLNRLGVPATASSSGANNYFDATRAAAHARRGVWGADWAWVIYMVDSLNDVDGLFSDGAFAYTYINGPFTVMTYDNDGWGINRLHNVAAHETGHIFGALDEYAASGCRTTDQSGYLGAANTSCNNGGVTSDFSIMGEASEQQTAGVDVSASARAALGWRNPTPLAAGSPLAVVDVVRTTTDSLTPFSPDPTSNTTPTFNATASNTPFPPGGCLMIGGTTYFCPNPVNIARVASAEWQVDGGAFTTQGVIPAGSGFGSETQAYTFTPPTPLQGTHTFGTRAINNFGHQSAVATDVLTITGTSSCAATQWAAQYWNNRTLSGSPVLNQCEQSISYDWGLGSPSASVPADSFSARWTGRFTFAADTYTFTARADDGVRLFVDGTAIIDQWHDQGPTTYQVNRAMTAGAHDVVVEYYENAGGAVIQVAWQAGSAGCPVGQFRADYYGNLNLSAPVVLSRCEASIDNSWGAGAPPGVPVGVDNFSVRWTGRLTFAAGTYNFFATADDGVRVFVDGNLIIDQWHDQGPTTYQGAATLTAGDHDVVVEYYEHTGGATIKVRWEPPVVCPNGRYYAEYFPNVSLNGPPTVTRCEASIDNQWGLGAPAVGLPTDNFSVRWSGRFNLPGGTYNFVGTTDDGMRLFVDGNLLIDQWHDQGPTEYRATTTLAAGDHEIVVEYYERAGGATAQFYWEVLCGTGQFLGRYYANMSLSGVPARLTCEVGINYEYGVGVPQPGVGSTNYSIRWSGQFGFAARPYTFTARADDGVRVYVDGTLIIDQWHDQGPTIYQATVPMSAGNHLVQVDYYQNAGGATIQVRWE